MIDGLLGYGFVWAQVVQTQKWSLLFRLFDFQWIVGTQKKEQDAKKEISDLFQSLCFCTEPVFCMQNVRTTLQCVGEQFNNNTHYDLRNKGQVELWPLGQKQQKSVCAKLNCWYKAASLCCVRALNCRGVPDKLVVKPVSICSASTIWSIHSGLDIWCHTVFV